jgi:transposase
MSPAFSKGIAAHLGTGDHQPEIVFDRYHVVAKVNDAVDQVRRAESRIRPELKGSRYSWLKNEANLAVKQRQNLVWLSRPSMALATADAYILIKSGGQHVPPPTRSSEEP